MVGGIGNGINTPCTIAVLSSYKEKREIYIGYFELCSGLGALLGPLLGSFFYFYGGFKAPFFTIGFTYLVMVFVFWKRSCSIRREKNYNNKNSMVSISSSQKEGINEPLNNSF